MRRLLILIVLVLAGCASTGPALTVAASTEPPPDPASLVGWWRVDGTRQVLLIDAAGLEIRDADLTIGGGLTLNGSWRADPDGHLLAHVDSVFGPAFDVFPEDMPEAAAEYAPDWLARAAGYRAEGEDRIVLDADGVEVARLVPEPPVEGSGVVDPGRALTDAERRNFGPAAPIPTGLLPAEQADLVGRWRLDGPHTPAYFEFAEDGTWTGFDGCNTTGGDWLIGPDGGFLATRTTAGTLTSCPDMFDVGPLVAGTRRVAFDGPALVLQDVDGRTSGPWKRS